MVYFLQDISCGISFAGDFLCCTLSRRFGVPSVGDVLWYTLCRKLLVLYPLQETSCGIPFAGQTSDAVPFAGDRLGCTLHMRPHVLYPLLETFCALTFAELRWVYQDPRRVVARDGVGGWRGSYR